MLPRVRPNGLNETIRIEKLNLDCFYSEEKKVAILYKGRSRKPNFYYSFKTTEMMYKKINSTIDHFCAIYDEKENRKRKIKELRKNFKASNFFKEGDIVYNSWGYGQTNVEFYQVVKVLPKSIRVREISQQKVEGSEGFDCCDVVAVKDSFLKNSKPFLLRLQPALDEEGYEICSKNSYYCFSKWNGKPKYKSWYY
ncbi:MAG: hypothetical protein KGV57_01395 [Fusobacterium sp.]|nr:hypothetical protein [Fusobacterium sp.]